MNGGAGRTHPGIRLFFHKLELNKIQNETLPIIISDIIGSVFYSSDTGVSRPL
ncbi:hypothetical protein [Alteribacillus sp. HJP-4]|uniref:hypothetical protein n=1 Tax=Alteribacillus sp. HJP-4 TaxID=2775394 RepID=UPI0035CD091B